ncbi:MAG: NAD(P)H-hydrate dehydratase [Arhodomonas sp.]|nr:NAD(P)H-hydrate dehydratase [Arhodomonas sp.]
MIGGDHGFGGAVRLAAEAAARSGAGLVSVATRKRHVAPLLAGRPEVMAHAVDSPGTLEPLLRRATVLAVGPGLGQEPWGRGMMAAAADFDGPVVLDADALNLLATEAPSANPRRVTAPIPARRRGCCAGTPPPFRPTGSRQWMSC